MTGPGPGPDRENCAPLTGRSQDLSASAPATTGSNQTARVENDHMMLARLQGCGVYPCGILGPHEHTVYAPATTGSDQ